MKLSIKIENIDYGDAAVKLLPLLADAPEGYPGTFGKKISALAGLSEAQIRDSLTPLSSKEKAELLAGFAAECEDALLSMINQKLSSRKIGVTVTGFTVDSDLTVTAHLGQLDYPGLVNRFLPAVRKKLLNMGGPAALLRPMIEKASAEQICGLLDRFAGSNKDAFLASLINQNQKKLVSYIEKAAKKERIPLKIHSVHAEA